MPRSAARRRDALPGTGGGPLAAGQVAALVLAAVGVLTGYGLLLWGLDRGFDGTDEGFVYTMIASDRAAVGEAWGFQHLLHPLYEATGGRVLVFRTLRVLGYAVTSVLLVLAARCVASAAGVAVPRHTWWFVLLVAQAGPLLAWSYPPRYLSYNEVSAWMSQLICAAVVLGLAARGRGLRTPSGWLPWAVAGLLVPPLLLAKFTAALVWVPLALLATLLSPSVRSAAGRAAVFLVAGCLSALGLVGAGRPFVGSVRRSWGMLTDPAAQAVSDHSVSEILETYGDSALETALAGLGPVVVLVALAVLVRRGLGRPVVLALPVALAVWLLVLPLGSWAKLGTVSAVMGVGGASVLLVAALPVRTGRGRVLAGLYALWLVLVTPVVAGVGTNNPIMGQTMWAATVWAVLLGTALAVLAAGGPTSASVHRSAPLLTGALMVWVTVALVATDSFIHPYRSQPLQEQTTTTSVPELAGIRLTPEQAATADRLRSVAEREDAAGVPAVAINAPGHLFVFNRSGWASPWRDGIWRATIEESCRTDRPKDLFVLDPGDDAPLTVRGRTDLVEALVACGYAFPDDFRVVDEFAGTVVWRLR
ncbi:hypothetical protein ACQE98_08000 [Ornithinimicrobium sp. W1679]|uniref:hypothetical protein n=1 Tax=Ornithinimicrobium sp. W1679 TaxID=3418770 RepID=UPI003CF3AF79